MKKNEEHLVAGRTIRLLTDTNYLRSPVDVQKLRVYKQEQLLSLSRISLGVEVVQKSLSRISLSVEVVQKFVCRLLRQLTKKNGGALSR